MIKKSQIFLILLALIACDSNRIFEKNSSINQNVWSLSQAPTFQYHNTDSITNANLFLNVRHTSQYPFSNLWTFVYTTSPKGHTTIDTVECLLAQKDGKWLGSGLGDIWDLQTKIGTIDLKEIGLYEFKVEQAMRHGSLAKIEHLPGVMEVGLRIEHQNK